MTTRRILLFIASILVCGVLTSPAETAPKKSRLIIPRTSSTNKVATATTTTSGETNVMTGTFTWTGKGKQRFDFKAVFTPTGPKEWDAVYTFKWDNNDTVFTGKASGSLKDGKVTGTAASGGRTWRFEGHAAGNRIRGDHVETTGGREVPTGDFELKRT